MIKGSRICKYTARGESRVANIEAKLSAIFASPRAVSFIQSVSALLYFTPINVQIKHSSLIVLNKGIQINGFL